MKRKLDDQEDKIADQSESIERQEEALGSLQSTVDQVVQTMQAVEVQQAQQQEQKQAAELKALQTQNLTVVLNDAARKSDLGDDQLIPQVEDSQVVTPRRAQMESRLLRAWERLKHWVRPVSGQSSLDDIPWQSPILARMSGLFDKWSEGSKGGFLKEEIRGYWAKQKAWNERFAKEIELVYAARNTVAHPRQDTALSDEKLSEALRLADILIYTAERELRESFERARGEAGKQALKFGELMSAGTALHHHRRAQMRQGQTMKPDRLAI